MTITLEQIRELIASLKACGLDPKPFSGRGMQGTVCVAVKNVSAWRVAWLLREEHDRLRGLPEPLEDQLGKSAVLYWPGYLWPGK